MQWEYTTKTTLNPMNPTELNSLGKAGWELVGVNERNTASGRGLIYHFKRPYGSHAPLKGDKLIKGPIVEDAKVDAKAYLEASKAAKDIRQTLDAGFWTDEV